MKQVFALAVFACSAALYAGDRGGVAIVPIPSPLPGHTTVRVDTLSQCVSALPADSALQVVSHGRDEYLKRILGGTENRYVKVWDAEVVLNYQRQSKLLYVLVPQGSLASGEPVFRESETNRMVSDTIRSDAGDGDFFAFSSPRRYYFDSEDKAKGSALARARQKLGSLRSWVCQAK